MSVPGFAVPTELTVLIGVYWACVDLAACLSVLFKQLAEALFIGDLGDGFLAVDAYYVVLLHRDLPCAACLAGEIVQALLRLSAPYAD